MFKMEFKTGNAAFDDENEDLKGYYKRMETARIIKRIATDIEACNYYGSCLDINGNKVGEWKLD